jgi:hypothetical protein
MDILIYRAIAIAIANASAAPTDEIVNVFPLVLMVILVPAVIPIGPVMPFIEIT